MKISNIKPDPKQPRKTFNEGELLELAKSIKTHGILQPIIVDQDGHIIDGERRYRAARKLGLEEVPAVELDSDGKRLAWQVVIDAQHKDVPIMERDKAWLKLWEELGKPPYKEMGKILGKSSQAVGDAIARAEFVPKVAAPNDDITYQSGETITSTKFIDDDELRSKVIKKADEIGDSRQKRSYLKRVKQSIEEGNVDEVLNEDITNYSKRADQVLNAMDVVRRHLNPGLMLKLPKTQAVILSQAIVNLREHLKRWDDAGNLIEDAEVLD